MIAANARTTTNLNARLSGSCAISASWHQVDERDFRKGNRERCASCFTLAQKNAQVVGADRQAALRDLRLRIKSESLERVMHDTPFGSSLESPGPPGAFFLPGGYAATCGLNKVAQWRLQSALFLRATDCDGRHEMSDLECRR